MAIYHMMGEDDIETAFQQVVTGRPGAPVGLTGLQSSFIPRTTSSAFTSRGGLVSCSE